MEKSSPRRDAEGNIFDQFDVQVTGELSPIGMPTIDRYFCRLPRCHGETAFFEKRRELIQHRLKIHSLPRTGAHAIPVADQIRQWLRRGKPRTNETPQELMESGDCSAGATGPSLLSKLLLCKPDTESELQPASLKSNIYEQFNVRYEPGETGGPPYVGFVCLLSQCHEEKVCFNNYAKWTRHRRRVHKETEGVQNETIPDAYEIREWVLLNKPRPHNVPVKRKAWKKLKLCPVDPAVFAEFDVKEDEQLQFFCLLDPCKEQGESFKGRRCWRKHREKYHMFPNYENGEYTLPSNEVVKDWLKAGKPHNYKPQRRVRTFINVDPPSATTSIALHNLEVNPTPSEVGNEENGQKSQALCPLPEDKESRKLCRSRNQHSQVYYRELHKLLSLEARHSLRSSKSLARLEKFRPITPPVEIPREACRRRGRRPRDAGAGGCSSNTEPAHQKKKTRRDRRPRDAGAGGCSSNSEPAHQKKTRHSIHSADRSHSTVDSTDSDSSDLAALRVVARGEDPSDCSESFWKQFMEETNPTCDETPPSDDVDEDSSDSTEDVEEESDDASEKVDDLSVDQATEDPCHDQIPADMEENGEKPLKDAARPEDALPSFPSRQPEVHDRAADVTEVDEDAHEEFEVANNVLPSQPELQIVNVVGRSSIQPRDFQGVVMDEHQQNSTAEMTEAWKETREEFEAPDNVLPAQLELQNITAVEYSSVQPQDFQKVTDVHQKNSTAEMVDADVEDPKDSVASENILCSLQYSTAEMGEVEDKEREDFAAQKALSALEYSQSKLWERSSVQPRDFQGDVLIETLPNPKMGEFGMALEELITPWNLYPSKPSNEPKAIALSPLWNLGGDASQCLPQDFPGENWPNSSRENNLRDSAEMAKYGEDAPEGFMAPRISSMQSDGTKVPSFKGPIDTQAPPIQEFVRPFSMDQVFLLKPSAAGMAEVGEEAPEGLVYPENVEPRIPFMHSEGTEFPSIQAAPIQETVPRVHMDPVFIEEPSAAGMREVGGVRGEALEELAAPRNLVPTLPSYEPQETNEHLYLSSLNVNASSQDSRNIQNEPIVHEFPWATEFIPHTDIASVNEPVEVVPFALSSQPAERQIGSVFMEGSAENFTEHQVDPVQEIINRMDEGRVFEVEPDLPVIDDLVEENPEEFFHPDAVTLPPQPMQQLFSSQNSESSNNYEPAAPVLQADPLIDMAAGLDYELSMRVQAHETNAWLFSERLP